jgi:TPR repeat protein
MATTAMVQPPPVPAEAEPADGQSPARVPPDIAGAESQARAPFTVTVKLKPSWDATLTYDLLEKDHRPGDEPVFVGREDQLGPLVNAIGRPDRRGTYLISGYRGVGKTSLIIEAARRASRDREAGWLLPVVLNVSEVAASLQTADNRTSGPLYIDARRLLTALLRALLNRFQEEATADPSVGQRLWTRFRGHHETGTAAPPSAEDRTELTRMIAQAYAKAGAASYSQTRQQRADVTETRMRETSAGFQMANVLKVVAAVAVLVAGVVEGVVVLRGAVNAVHVVALTLAAGAVLSLAWSAKISKSATRATTASEELVLDNSLHQLESELKDILERLHRLGYRTLIVLEELDKIDDEPGDQLDAVIRYFKNLFTQAPALFFFLTDKAYYDLIAGRIEKGRRERSYAVEHTFFTQRVFVRRPGLEDCLSYLEKIMVLEDDRAEVAAVGTTQSLRVRRLDEMSDIERFVRVLLFRSQYHFFDLKAAMRPFVRITQTRNPDAEAGAAQLTKSGAVRGLVGDAEAGNGEAPEEAGAAPRTKNGGAPRPVGDADGNGDSWLEADDTTMPPAERALAAFHFLVEQKVQVYRIRGLDYLNETLQSCLFAVFESLGSTEPQDVTQFYPATDSERDRLDLAQRERVVQAVDSLVEDLRRGHAIEMLPATQDVGTRLVWQKDSALSFVPVARLQEHEQMLQESLARLRRITDTIRTVQRFDEFAVLPHQADGLHTRLVTAEGELGRSTKAMSKEKAEQDRRDFEREAEPLARAAIEEHVARLRESSDVTVLPVTADPEPVYRVSGRDESSNGALLLYQRVTHGPPVPLASLHEGPGRVAIVVVTLDDEATADEVLSDWGLADVAARDGTLRIAVPLHEGLPAPPETRPWGRRTEDELRFAELWSAQPRLGEPDGDDGHSAAAPQVLLSGDGTTQEFPSLDDAMARWWESGNRVLGLNEKLGPPWDRVHRWLDTGKTDQLLLLPRQLTANDDDRWRRLAANHRLVVRLSGSGGPDWIWKTPGLRVVFTTDELPPDMRGGVSVVYDKTSADRGTELARLVRKAWPLKAVELLRPAGEINSVDALVELTLLTADARPAEFRTWLDRLIQTKDAPAQVWVGERLEERHLPEALDLYRAAAQQRHPKALSRLVVLDPGPDAEEWEGQLIALGRARPLVEAAEQPESRDSDRDLRLYRAAAALEDAQAIARLVVLLADSEPQESRSWQEKLERTGDGDRLFEVAAGLQPQDEERAVDLYRLAAEAGSTRAAGALVVLMADRDDAEFERERQRLVQAKAQWPLYTAAQELDRVQSPMAVRLYQDAVEAGNTYAEPRLRELLAESPGSAEPDALESSADAPRGAVPES